MIVTLTSCFSSRSTTTSEDIHVKWNNNNHFGVILNVDGSCLGSPVRAGFGGVIRNELGYYLSGFSGFVQGSSDILFAELFVIHRGLILAKYMAIDELVCYSDSLRCINLIK
ncbi:ribonuclease H protein, partial [Trifolium medium]|nr:ribonuclease H protein [Trifolium medium]